MAKLNFDPVVGIEVPEASEIAADLGKAIQLAFQQKPSDPPINIEPTSPMGQVLDALAAEVIAKNSEVAYVAGQNNLSICEGRYLDALVSLYFVDRKLSEPTIVQCKCTGLTGTVIPYGAIVSDSNGNQYRHNVAAGAVIGAEGYCLTTFSAVEHGALEVAESAVTQIVTVIPGWDSVSNPEGGVTGRVRESDAELRTRYRKSVAINSVGNVATIAANIANIAGVIDVQVLENVSSEKETQYGVEVPGHGIAVCVFGGEDDDIARSIYKTKMGGTSMGGKSSVSFVDVVNNIKRTYPIYRPTVKNLYVKIEFYASSMDSVTQENVKQIIVKDALGQLKNPRIGLAQTVYADRFRSAIASITNVPVKSIALSIDEPSSWVDKLKINADVEPSIQATNVQISLPGE